MNFGGFLAYCILLTAFWGQVYWVAHNHFHSNQGVKEALKKEVMKNVQLQLAYDILSEKKVSPEEGHGAIREVASVLNVGESFKKAKSAFGQEDYTGSLKVFNRIVESGIDSPYSAEAYLLKAEAEYRIGEKENSVLTIKKMIRLYPDNKHTGYALLKLARIYKDENHVEESIDTYKAIIKTFADKELVEEARKKLGALEP